MSYVISDNIITSLGTSTEEVLKAVEAEYTGIVSDKFRNITEAPVSLIDRSRLNLKNLESYTFFEQISILSIEKALDGTNITLNSPETLLILSTTKGNIELLETENQTNDGLISSAADKISSYFDCANKAEVVCNACISGVLALNVAHRYLKAKLYKHVVVCGADVASRFVVAGFESFKSMSTIPCQPFDKNRTGLSLGEGAGTIILSNTPSDSAVKIKITGGSSANDANHISGPSRTGEGAYLSASRALDGDYNIDFISAHGTATPYNDDMESVAITRLNLNKVPVNSFKGYWGHTLGAAGVIESIITIRSMQMNRMFRSLGTQQQGTVENINVLTKHKDGQLNRCLKIASGFGGCNAAIVFEKNA